MQTYRIDTFINLNLPNTDPNQIVSLDSASGSYIVNNEEQNVFYFLCNSLFRIHKVTNKKTNIAYERGQSIVDKETGITSVISLLTFTGKELRINALPESRITVKKPEDLKKVYQQKLDAVTEKISKKYPRALRLDNGILKNRKESVEKFLDKFFTKWNSEKNTIYADTKEIQTVAGRRRSLGDIFALCKYYYPDVKLEQIINHLHDNIKTKTGWRTSYCSQTRCRMYYFASNSGNGVWDSSSKDEYEMTYADYKLKK